jgi:RNA polymerase primary sigma factor
MRQLNQFLKMAVMAGVESAVLLHIDRGDDLNARDSNGLTLLMLSAKKNKSAMCQLLLNAGADGSLLDNKGRTAYAIAVAAGALQAAEVLAPRALIQELPTTPELAQIPICDAFPKLELASKGERLVDTSFGEVGLPTPIKADALTIIVESDKESFNLLEWEPEDELAPPELDPTLAAEASAVQAAISAHEPIDSSTDWDDVEVFLPEQSVPFIRKDNLEARESLRLLLLRAHREGSLPSMAIKSLSINEDRTENPELEALLTLVVNDLGAEVDERFEYATYDEDFTVFTSPHESESEEEVIDNALHFVDSVVSRRSEPLRSYLREFQKIKLISGDAEVALAQRMEEQHSRALDALTTWPNGLKEVLAAGSLVQSKMRTLFSVSMGPLEVQPELGDSSDEPGDLTEADADSEIIDEEVEEANATPDGAASIFFDALLRLSELAADSPSTSAKTAIRKQLELIRLNTGFLFELTKAACIDTHEAAREFAEAMNGYLKAREQMVAANLKLAFHTAKKYVYCGEPLDDLAQEANIGLMKAVERFDWRRGYKFSTYATWWIRQQITRSIADTVRTIRTPVHVHEKLQRLFKEKRDFEAENGRQPEQAEIAERLGMSLRSLETLERIPQELTTIDETFDDELIDSSAHDSFVSPDPFEVYAESQFRRTVDALVSSLKLKEEKVTRLRFGIGVNTAFTLEEVGVAYGVTRERIRQIEAKALRKLRHPNQSDLLSMAFSGVIPEREKIQPSVDATDDPANKSGDAAAQEYTTTVDLVAGIESPVEIMAPLPPEPPPVAPNENHGASLFTQPPITSKSLDRILSQIENSGVRVLDDRQGPTGKIWVDVPVAKDGQYRQLVRKLLAAGFEYSPGKGFWK